MFSYCEPVFDCSIFVPKSSDLRKMLVFRRIQFKKRCQRYMLFLLQRQKSNYLVKHHVFGVIMLMAILLIVFDISKPCFGLSRRDFLYIILKFLIESHNYNICI